MQGKLLEIQQYINRHNEFLQKALSNIDIEDNESLDKSIRDIELSMGSLMIAQTILKDMKMALYEYKCTNEECEDFNKVKDVKIPMSEYSEDKLPLCDKCNSKTSREYSAVGHQTFSDGYKG